MKTTLNTLLIFLIVSGSAWGQFQSNVAVSGKHYHDVCIEPISYNNPQSDFIVAGNLFDSAFLSELAFIKRVDENGVVIWNNTYQDSNSSHFRILDIISHEDFIFATGYVDFSGERKLFIAQFNASTGSYIQAEHYEINHFGLTYSNSTGVHISYTESDANGDGANDPGFLIAGYASVCYNVDVNCSDNKGLVLRTDYSLGALWTVVTETSTNSTTSDYDFVNNITETSDGLFITGSGNYEHPIFGYVQQCVLAHKLNFQGNWLWDSSYLVGNSNDVSVDAYYDVPSDKIFMLSNYSISHSYGITAFDNNGSYDASRSWYAQDPDYMDTYGFTLMPSLNDSNNLIVSGYDREEYWSGGINTLYGETNAFVSEFDKNTGNPVIQNYIYTVENVSSGVDDYNFWNFQMPLMYYPDMSFQKTDMSSDNHYYLAGYRIANQASGEVNLELFKVDATKENTCDSKLFEANPFPLVKQNKFIESLNADATGSPFSVTASPMPYTEESCSQSILPSDSAAYCCPGDNFVTNGNFEDILNPGFTSSYGNTPLAPGNYTIGTSATAQTNFNATVTDHSYCENSSLFSLNQHFMLVNGRTQQTSNARIWQQTITGLEPYSNYMFCANFKNMNQCTFDTLLRVNMQVASIGSSGFSAISAPNTPCSWVDKQFHFTTGNNTSYTLRIILEQTVNGDGNDLAIDDIAVIKLADPELSISVEHQGNPHQIVASINTMSTSPSDDVLHGTDCAYYWFVAEVGSYPPVSLVNNTFAYGNGSGNTFGSNISTIPWNLTTDFNPDYIFAQNKLYIIGMYTPVCECYDEGFTFQLTLNNRSDEDEVMTEELKQQIIDWILNGYNSNGVSLDPTQQLNDGSE